MAVDECCPKCGMVLPRDLCPRCTFGEAMGGVVFESGNENAPEIPGLTVHEELGEGGFGIVYRATQTGVVQRRVALKILKPGVDTRQVLRRFEVERQALALLEHPNIARMYDAGETSTGYPWFTMEYIEGRPVTECLVNVDLKEAVRTLLPVCVAMEYAHEKGIIHRDLKPSNVLMTEGGQAKIIDFGIAKATNPEVAPGMTVYTGGESWVGTPTYMAPEQAVASELEPDERVDVYALGAILYEVVTGITPLEAATGKATREFIGTEKVPRASEVALKEVPQDLEQVLSKALEKNPEERYETVRDFAADLRRFLNEEKVTIRRKKRRMSCWLWVAAACFLGALVPVFWGDDDTLAEVVRHESSGLPFGIELSSDGSRGLGIFRNGGRAILFDPEDGREVASLPAEANSILTGSFSVDGERFLLGYRDGTWRWFSAEDGEALSTANEATSKGDGVQLIRHAVLKGTKEPVVLTAVYDRLKIWTEEGELLAEIPLLAGPYRFAISPDGGLGVIGSRDGRINVIDLETRKRVKILEGQKAAIHQLRFTPDGTRFLSTGDDEWSTVWMRDGSVEYTLKNGGRCEGMDVSPDGKLVAIASHDGSARIWSIESGELLHELIHRDRVYAVKFSPDGKWLVSGGRGEQAKIWDVKTGELKVSYDCGDSVGELSFTMDGSKVIALTWERALRLIPLPKSIFSD